MWLNSIIINRTIKLEVVGEEKIKTLHDKGEKIIFAFWHRATFSMFYYYRRQKICALPVDNYLGSILDGFFRRYGFITVRYPERGSPIERVEAIAKLIKTIKDEDCDCGLAVDGPPGEKLFKAKPGVFYLAARTGHPILPVGIYYGNAHVLNFRWDRYIMPKMFSKAVMVIGDPIYVKEKLSDVDMGKMADGLEKNLHELTAEAKKICLAK